MTTMAKNVIPIGADNRPPMFKKIVEDGITRARTYEELIDKDKIHEECDIRATNIVLQGLPPDVSNLVNHHTVAKEIWEIVKLFMEGTELSLQERECKFYNEFDKFTSEKGETIYLYYLRFAQLINDINTIGMTMQKLEQPYHAPVIHSPPVFPQQAYQAPTIQHQPQAVFPQLDYYLAVPSFLPRHLPIQETKPLFRMVGLQCKTCRGDKVMVLLVMDRRVLLLAKGCTQPKRPRNSKWFKEKMLLVQALMSRRDLRELSGEEAWEAIENFDQWQKEWDNPPNIISEKELANLKAPVKILFRNEKECTLLVTYPKEVEEIIGIPIEVEPSEETPLEDLGLNTCNHDLPLSSREVPSFDKPDPQPQPLPNYPPLDASLGNKRGLKPPIKPYSPDSFRMKALDNLTIHTPPSSLVASLHLRDLYCYYHPCLDNPKKHYGFKLSLLGHSGSLGVDFSNFEMIEDDW
ncbi:hypothetical protein Tco_0059598 [Tanacetum coccineum]